MLFESRKRYSVADVEFEALGKDKGCILKVLNPR
jgi:hypothetical protein